MQGDSERGWVVYRMPVKDDPVGPTAVCSRPEWDKLTAARPGVFTLVRDGIESEGEAERLARGTAGDRPTSTRPSRPSQVVRVSSRAESGGAPP